MFSEGYRSIVKVIEDFAQGHLTSGQGHRIE